MEALNIIVPVFTAVLVAFVTYFLTKSHYERKRQDELADRGFNRRAAIHDMRIQEARDSLDTWSIFIGLTSDIERLLRESSSMEMANASLEPLAKEYENINVLLHEASNKGASIDILNDDELTNLRKELLLGIESPMLGMIKIADKVLGNEEIDIKELKLEGYKEAFRKAEKIIVRMKARLDELAQSVP